MVASGLLSLAVGIWMFAFILVKSLYYSLKPGAGLLPYALESNLKDFIEQLYGNWAVVRWTFNFVPDLTNQGPLAFFTPAGLMVLFLIYSPALFALPNARKLKRWMNETNELMQKQEMLASRGGFRNQQSIGNVRGRDINLSQEITNHFNHAPDNPLKGVLTAVLAAVASAVVAFLLNQTFAR